MHIIRLEERRLELQVEMALIGPMRRGSIHVSSRRCRNKSCPCHKKGHPGHDPINTYTEVVDGETITRQYPDGPEWEQLKAKVENFQRYCALSEEFIDVVNAISDYDNGSAVVGGRWELSTIKKNSRKYIEKLVKKKLSELQRSL
jgi:hypothetical protein